MPKLLIILLFFGLSGCLQTQSVEQITGKTMGTSYTIKTQGKVDQSLIDQRLKQINQIFSSWDQHSELSKVNQHPIDQPVRLSAELLKVLSESIWVSGQTQGFFDPALGSLIDVWGFGATKVAQKPSRNKVASALKNASISKVSLEADQLTKQADIKLNLSAVAKGYAVDEVARLLDQQQIERYMVEIGGEVKAKGRWTIGIETPAGQAPIAIDLMNESIATSGNYRQYFVWEGEQYAHILDPHTGLPVNSDLFSVSVIHPSNLLADAYATAMMAMGSVKAQQLAETLKLKVVLILKSADDSSYAENIIKLGL
ncbi:MAG: FAD:protein FMN transferase [Candidatus Thioglobus sp.]|uniref:FAD:protein FMN transferase n=1 Tax=Candidatus Thioglobus sp. TaxID=2026721 RepID=UPI0026127250|nr:FAD:protein FMN transferase [Candidatus Thioglobus sp.]MDC9726978.1 FAD:protein FMN transferase [Candidatus Thioglobus sp.]